jgi:hypothetical protein
MGLGLQLILLPKTPFGAKLVVTDSHEAGNTTEHNYQWQYSPTFQNKHFYYVFKFQARKKLDL